MRQHEEQRRTDDASLQLPFDKEADERINIIDAAVQSLKLRCQRSVRGELLERLQLRQQVVVADTVEVRQAHVPAPLDVQ
ncbi:hypothetical protein D3C83_128080 [compost metagenome]